MNVGDLMQSDVKKAAPGDTLKDAARTLVENRISGMPVCDEQGRVLGVISEGDILHKERGRSERRTGPLGWLMDGSPRPDATKAAARTVAEAMTSPAVTVVRSNSAATAARLMIEKGVNRLPVVAQGERLVGIVTRADLVRAFTRSDLEIKKEIRDDVLRRILWAEPSAVDVSVREGEVRADGQLETSTDVEIFERLVRRIPGVVSVRSRLTFRVADGDRERSRR